MIERAPGENPHTSVVIPVYNKWELTEACLRSLADTLAGQGCEIIVVDNASSDATAEACPALGQTLFGDFFRYHRAERNCNFAPASNLGARLARGDFLLFLNNDTLAVPGYKDWHGKLVRDFSLWPDVAATGPMLLFPPGENPLGATVQHLGVYVTPFLRVGHLYEGLPASSPLAARRRFFQVITAACMLMPRALFWEQGGFDEGFVNGFEDVDLCARIFAAGWRMTVNPEARLYHLAGQSPGRHEHEEHNFRRLEAGSLRLLTPDWHVHAAADGLELQVNEWLSINPGLKARDQAKLAPLLAAGDADALAGALGRFPLWHEGYAKLADLLHARGDMPGAKAVLLSLAKLLNTPDNLFPLLRTATALNDKQTVELALLRLCGFCAGFDAYMESAEIRRAWVADLGLGELAGQFRRWQERAGGFRERSYLPFLRRLREVTRSYAIHQPVFDWSYTLWLELEESPKRERRRQNPAPADASIAFSVLMPVYDPEPDHLREAVDSLLAQDWPHWELCLADDASPDPRIRPLLLELAARDPRIRVEFRPANGHIAAATNTSLGLARHDWAVLMDQDDTLTPDALREVAAAITARPEGLLFYSDEDKLQTDKTLLNPYFKNDAWDYDLLLGQNMVCHLGVYRTDRLRAIGGFRDGFPGSQDHDMLLRYVEDLNPARLVHIPKVLYHWRVHAGSTAAGIEAKPEALDSGLRAVTEHLRRKGVAGKAEIVPGTQFYRVRYGLPAPAPLVSLVADLGGELFPGRDPAGTLTAKAGYGKLEILLLHDAEAEPALKSRLERLAAGQKQIRPLALPRSLSFGERANAAVAAARGRLLGFVGKELQPVSQDWLAEIVSRLAQPGVGAVGGKLLDPAGRVQHLGHEADDAGRLFSLFRGLPASAPSYFGWAALARTVPSVDPRCLFAHKELIEKAGGFAPDMGGASALDLCLRLGEMGSRTVATPFAVFALASGADAPWENASVVSEPVFVERWRGRIAPCHPNLARGYGGWAISWPEEDRAAHAASAKNC